MGDVVAVIAHRRKRLDGDLCDLRAALFDAGVTDPLWFEVKKGKQARKRAREALDAKPDLVIVWGGDGTVRGCVQELASTGVAIGVIPAGTANLLARSLDIPGNIAGAVDVALHGRRQTFDVGNINGERFTVMAGTGLDARMMAGADRGLKDRIGLLAYLWAGATTISASRNRARIVVDGEPWFDGGASCVLVANIGTIAGGLVVFKDARPDDGRLEIGVVTARSTREWLAVLLRLAFGAVDRSELVRTTAGRCIEVTLGRKAPYELDGGDRDASRHLEVEVESAAIVLCTPGGST